MAVYVVWSPQLGAEEEHVPGGPKLIPDPRVRHYWDPGARAGTLYMPILARLLGRGSDAAGTLEPAWDTWMLFNGAARWTGTAPPVPVWWEHQLAGLPEERRLDPARFGAKAIAVDPAGGAQNGVGLVAGGR